MGKKPLNQRWQLVGVPRAKKRASGISTSAICVESCDMYATYARYLFARGTNVAKGWKRGNEDKVRKYKSADVIVFIVIHQ